MSDDEKIVEGFKMWLASFDDDGSKRIKRACVRGSISLHELIDALRRYEIKMIRRSYNVRKG